MGNAVGGGPAGQDPREDLAQCLARSGMTLHGTTWCGWCKKQLDDFGPAAGTVPYIDCTRPDGQRGFSDECKAKGIQVVPSWTTGTGQVMIGTQSLRTLAKESRCGHLVDTLAAFDVRVRHV